MTAIGDARLLLITDDSCTRAEITATMQRALRAASQHAPQRDTSPILVMARAPSFADREFFHLARELRDITRQARARLVINRRIDIALAVDADGVHLPERALLPHDARDLLGESALIGISRHASTLASGAAYADYATLAPIFPVPCKGPALGTDVLRSCVASSRTPVFALGGINSRNAAAVLHAGAHGIALQRGARDVNQVDSILRILVHT